VNATTPQAGPAGGGTALSEVTVRGPAFEDLSPGQLFDTAPPVTLTDGLAAAHQAIVGERSWLGLSRPLAAEVLGGPVALPSLVWNVSIGQSALATQQVLANLYYRGLVLRRQPHVGDTLHTATRVAGLRQNRPRAGRPATGLAVRSRVRACGPETGTEGQVLDWRFVAVCSAAETAADILHPVRSLSAQGYWSRFDERGQR
jgi:acyl dehydratase